MKALLLYIIFLPYTIFSQQLPKESVRWLNENIKDSMVEPKELKTEFIKNDFSNLWAAKQETTIGFIGDNLQRFYIYLQEIHKNNTDNFSYLVKGNSRVINNICTFEGEIKILHIREINKKRREEMLKIAKQENDTELLRRFEPQKYIVLSEYTFKENGNQKGSGAFRGVMKSNFYIKNNKIFYNDLDYGDSYSNNSCVGIWQSYKTSALMKCNWGNYRIPFCGDLDGGAGEFYPTDQYLKSGWQNYREAYFNNNKEVLKEEERKWWETNQTK